MPQNVQAESASIASPTAGAGVAESQIWRDVITAALAATSNTADHLRIHAFIPNMSACNNDAPGRAMTCAFATAEGVVRGRPPLHPMRRPPKSMGRHAGIHVAGADAQDCNVGQVPNRCQFVRTVATWALPRPRGSTEASARSTILSSAHGMRRTTFIRELLPHESWTSTPLRTGSAAAPHHPVTSTRHCHPCCAPTFRCRACKRDDPRYQSSAGP